MVFLWVAGMNGGEPGDEDDLSLCFRFAFLCFPLHCFYISIVFCDS